MSECGTVVKRGSRQGSVSCEEDPVHGSRSRFYCDARTRYRTQCRCGAEQAGLQQWHHGETCGGTAAGGAPVVGSDADSIAFSVLHASLFSREKSRGESDASSLSVSLGELGV